MSGTVDFPTAKKAAPTEQKKDEATGVPNWAKNQDTVDKYIARAVQWFTKFDAQANRTKMEEDLKNSDQMFFMGTSQTKQSENKTSDETDTVPDAAFRALRAVTANDNETLYADDEIGASYKPLDTIIGDARDEAMARADEQKVLLEYSFEIDKRKQALQDAQWYVNKNSNCMFGMEWLSEKRKVRDRVPTGFDEDGKPTGTKWETKTVTKQHPHLVQYDLDKVWIDAMIKDIQQQQCILMRSFPNLSTLVKKQSGGSYVNVAKLGDDQLFMSAQPSNTSDDIQSNADSDGDSDSPTGEFDQWDVVMYAPINDEGEWDEENQYPRRFTATFEGHITGGKSVCVRLNPNAYDPDENGEIPYYWQSSHWDEKTKGAYSRGFFHFLWPIYQEYKTTLDQWFHNKNLQMNAPWITERGAIHTADKTFGPRRLLEMQMGLIEKLKRVEVPSVTGDMQAFIAYLEARLKETAGTTDPFLGQPMGSRTSASEARQAFEQALKPANERLRMMARLLEWIAEWDMRMWRMFADADLTLALVNKSEIKEIKPAELWGPLRVKVTAIDDYRTNIMVQREQDAFMRETFPVVKETMGRRNTNNLLKWIYRKRDFPVDEIFEPDKEGDAVRVARSENLTFQNGIWDAPAPDENHEIHISIHKDGESMFKLMPDDDLDPDTMRLIQTHIEMHKQIQTEEFAKNSQSAQQGAGPGGPQPLQLPGEVGTGDPNAAPPRTEGELEGDIIGGEGGSLR